MDAKQLAQALGLAALLGCTGGSNQTITAQAPLHDNGGQLSIDTASASSAGALSAADWSAFNGKASADDPRFSDARAPTAGSSAYIQNGTAPQSASFNITGAATIGGGVVASGPVSASTVQASYLIAGSGMPDSADERPGDLFLLGATRWGLETSESPALQIIDRTDNVRRAIFDTAGNVYFGGRLDCVSGCSAGVKYTSSTQETWVSGQLSAQSGRVQRDAAFFDPEGNTATTPVHIKTSFAAARAPAFRFNLEGYNWGADAPIDSICLGSLGANGLTGQGCTDKSPGAASAVYVSSDGFLTVRVSSASIAQAGFTLSAAYYFAAVQTSELHVSYQLVRSAADL